VNNILVNALILAGADKENTALGTNIKALIDIHGKAMIEYVIEALRESGLVHKIAVVGPFNELDRLLHNKVDYIVEDKASILNNVMEGVSYLGKEEDLLISTCDIPMLTPECIADFINKSASLDADLCYPIVNKIINEQKCSGIVRTYTQMKEGSFTGGNLFYIKPHIVQKCCRKAEELISQRKNSFKMSKVLGLKVLFLLMIKKLSIQQAEQRFSEVFSIKARAVISEYPEIANDVDKESDLDFVRRNLSKK